VGPAAEVNKYTAATATAIDATDRINAATVKRPVVVSAGGDKLAVLPGALNDSVGISNVSFSNSSSMKDFSSSSLMAYHSH
jgi:phosphate starvation-inducible protein PhoH